MNITGNIVFSSGKEGDYDIFSLNLESNEIKQLTSGESFNDCPKWSPDGKKIVFISNRTGTPEIWTMNADGSDQKRVTDKDRWHNTPSWSADGSKFVFCANYDGNINIYTMNVDGSDIKQITDYEGADYTPQFSPDGKKIIYTSKCSGNEDIWLYDIETSTKRQITTYEGKDFCPSYSPDGSKIAFISGLLGGDGKENLEIYVMDSNGDNIKRVTYNLGSDRFVTWSPSGEYLLYASSKPNSSYERLMIMDLEKKKAQNVDFDRHDLDTEIGADAKGAFFFKFLPEDMLRNMYPDKYFGSERYPDWI